MYANTIYAILVCMRISIDSITPEAPNLKTIVKSVLVAEYLLYCIVIYIRFGLYLFHSFEFITEK